MLKYTRSASGFLLAQFTQRSADMTPLKDSETLWSSGCLLCIFHSLTQGEGVPSLPQGCEPPIAVTGLLCPTAFPLCGPRHFFGMLCDSRAEHGCEADTSLVQRLPSRFTWWACYLLPSPRLALGWAGKRPIVGTCQSLSFLLSLETLLPRRW